MDGKEKRNIKKKMKNILVYGMTGNIGGLENYIMYQYRQFDKSKIHMDFVSAYKNTKIAYYDELIQRGSKVYDLSDKGKWKSFLQCYKNIYDIMIFNVTNPLDLYMLNEIKDSKAFKKIIIHSHNGGIDFSKSIKRLMNRAFLRKQKEFKEINAILWACSDIAGKWMFGDDAAFTIIKNGIDTNQFKFNEKVRDEVRQELALSPSDFVIGNIARFAIQKNHKLILKIFEETVKQIPEAKLLLVGQNAPQFSMLKQITQIRAFSHRLSSKIKFLGLRKDADRLYQAFDAFILPSLYEGLPIVGVEAQCSGLPCLFSDTITEEVNLLNTTNYLPISTKAAAKEWASQLERISTMPKERKNAYLSVREKGFDIKTETQKVQKILLNL